MMKDTNSKTQNDESAAIIALVLGIGADMVRKVLRGERNNPRVIALHKHYQKGKKLLIKELQQMAKELIKESR
jgi:hypothetical protein